MKKNFGNSFSQLQPIFTCHHARSWQSDQFQHSPNRRVPLTNAARSVRQVCQRIQRCAGSSETSSTNSACACELQRTLARHLAKVLAAPNWFTPHVSVGP
ncbi:hypothetical protein TIFTF001_023879 [Ficus carica]|uniref:Uncharacterized protein n=1 Tax=Ficus carica TaxID=3494 RepID=A0AA88DCU6_FICCA|nr:hypothetical protein TIFTF001_023879 [Ficus carica]